MAPLKPPWGWGARGWTGRDKVWNRWILHFPLAHTRTHAHTSWGHWGPLGSREGPWGSRSEPRRADASVVALRSHITQAKTHTHTSHKLRKHITQARKLYITQAKKLHITQAKKLHITQAKKYT